MSNYPTAEDLQAIDDWGKDLNGLLDHLNNIWEYDPPHLTNGKDVLGKKVKILHVSTWGWSGNEDIIGHLQNTFFWFLYWRSSVRGGHYTFEIPLWAFEKRSIELGRIGNKTEGDES